MTISDMRDVTTGLLPEFAHPGGYPIVYITSDCGVLCPDCANGENGSLASEDHEDRQWKLVTYAIHYEGEPEVCEHCGAEVESAYGPVEGK